LINAGTDQGTDSRKAANPARTRRSTAAEVNGSIP
jgi:hypothetical protein